MYSNPILAEDNQSSLLSSRAVESKGSTVFEIKAALVKKFGLKTIQGLIDSHRLDIVQNVEELRERLSGLALLSKKNTITGFVVPDAFANENNKRGVVGTIQWKKENGFPEGDIVVRPGKFELFIHRGFGAKHLTANVIEFPSRNFYKEEENKTEAALRTLVDVLRESKKLFKESETSYTFYSPRFNRAVPCVYDEKQKVFLVITDRPVKPKIDLTKIWGSDCVGLSGALIFPDRTDSVAVPSLRPDVSEKQTEHQPTTSHEGHYTSVNYTAQVEEKLRKTEKGLRKSGSEVIQGCYDTKTHTAFLIADNLSPTMAPGALLHEVGVHMGFDSVLRGEMYPIILAAPRILDLAFAKNDPAAVLAKTSLLANRISTSSSNYCEEACGYLVEACSALEAKEPKVINFYKNLLSTTNLWLVNHDFKECENLSPRDLLTAAKANVETLSKLPKEKSLSEEGKKILSDHVKQLSQRYSSLKDAEGEIRALFRYFLVLEENGKPLPQVQKKEIFKQEKGDER